MRRRTAYVAATTAVGVAILGAAALEAVSLPIGLLALFCAAAALSERFQVDSDDALDAAASRFSFSSGVHLAAIVVAGPWIAALAAAFGVVFVDRLRSSPWHRVGFNASVFALATVSGAAAWQLAGGQFGTIELPGDFAPFAAMAITYAVVNDVLVGIVLALTSGGGRLVSSIRETLRSDWTTDAAEAGLGALLAFILLREPWAVIALAPLALAAYQAHARLALVRGETARALETFANVVDERDPYTYRHSARVATYVEELAAGLRLPDAQIARLRWAGRLHDLGKVAVDASVLRRPGKLDESEWEAMRRHPRLSARILRRFHLAADQSRAVEFHHERFDGHGYYGVAGRDLPLGSHFLVVADSYDAMTSDRPYRRGLPRDDALAEIERGAGTQFHPIAARAFVALQRGEDPAAVLSLAERTELSRAFAHSRLRRPNPFPLPRAEGAILAGGTAALVGIGVGAPSVVAAGLLVAAAGVVWIRLAVRAGRTLEAILVDAMHAPAPFEAFARALAAKTHLAWAGLVRWDEAALDGKLEFEWDELGLGPSAPALTSWLARESDLGADLLTAEGNEVGAAGPVVALPLRRPGASPAFLALSFQRRLPRHVRSLLASFPDELQEPLLAALPDRPLLRAAS